MTLHNKYNNLIIDRCGDFKKSNMTTIDIINEIKPHYYYKILKNSLLETDNNKEYIQGKKNNNENIKYIIIDNTWNKNMKTNTKISNILGNSGILKISNKYLDIFNNLCIPETNILNLKWYNCKLYTIGDIIKINTNTILPLFKVQIGENYVKHYIMKKAGGVYLEYHNRPHFYMPLNKYTSGYLIIGKFLDNKIALSAFKIPYGYS